MTVSSAPKRVLLVYPAFPYSYYSYRETNKLQGIKSTVAPLGLLTVAALLPKQWELKLVDLNAEELTDEDWEWADMIMISAMIVQREGTRSLIKEANRRGTMVVAGGAYPTSMYEDVLEAGVDFLVKGEGEVTVPLLLEALDAGETKGVIECPQRPAMTDSPAPLFDLLHMEYYDTIPLQSSRGCPFNCEFCDIINLFGRKPRYKTADQVIGELDSIYKLGWRKDIFFVDDNFIGNKVHAKEILAKLTTWNKKNGSPFGYFTQASVNLGQDPKMIDLLTEANFATVFVGVESPDEEILKMNDKMQNIKNPLAESLDNINKNGLTVLGSFILGFDGEPKGMGERICKFVELTNLPIFMLNILHILPNTRLWDRIIDEGRMREENLYRIGSSTVHHFNFVPTRPEAEILGEYIDTLEYLYEPSRYLERTYRYYMNMRPTRRATARSNGTPLLKDPNAAPRYKPTLKEKIVEAKVVLAITWRQGILSKHRVQWWRQLISIRKNNPSRFIRYFIMLALGENMFDFRRVAISWRDSMPKES